MLIVSYRWAAAPIAPDNRRSRRSAVTGVCRRRSQYAEKDESAGQPGSATAADGGGSLASVRRPPPGLTGGNFKCAARTAPRARWR